MTAFLDSYGIGIAISVVVVAMLVAYYRWRRSEVPDAVDSGFLRTTGVQPSWDGIGAPGQQTQGRMLDEFPVINPRPMPGPTHYDQLDEVRNTAWRHKDSE